VERLADRDADPERGEDDREPDEPAEGERTPPTAAAIAAGRRADHGS
jgi:hypothetical protein